VTTSIEELLRDDEPAILAEAASSVARLERYRRDGDVAARRRIEALYRHLAGAVSARDLDDLLAHAARIARERFEAGFELHEVDAAFATLEDAISRRALARLPLDELGWGIGLVTTALAHARAELGRTFASLAPAARHGTVDLTAVFQRTGRGLRPAEDLVFPV
jgi:hypothetical protein